MKNLFGASGGRKFFLIFISVVLSNVVLGAHLITETGYTTLVLGLCGMYIGGNVVQKKEELKYNSESEVDPENEVEGALEEIALEKDLEGKQAITPSSKDK